MKQNLILICSFSFLFIHAQSLYIPLEIKKAFENKTRDYSGIPGDKYWQNFSDYDIDVSFNPKTLIVKGKATIIYHNNSPVQIDHIVLRLYQDHFKKGNTRNRQVVASDITEGTIIHSLTTATDTISAFNRSGTNYYVYLKNYLEPGDSIILQADWEFSLPKIENQRFGQYNGGWFISLWYPQVSVFDDIHGWDTYNFDWEQEFYNDFNNYKVKVTVPRNYLVQATGSLLNPEETLDETVYKKYLQAKESDSIILIVGQNELNKSKVTQKKVNLTWIFYASHVPDFAFCVSNEYWWEGRSLSISEDDGFSKRIFVSSLYHPSSQDFRREVTNLAVYSLSYLSNEMPGIPYPYDNMTVFNGASGGMEYPMIVNNASSKKRYFTVILTSHEIAHTYFPFYTGINERKYAWMDEGWAEFLPLAFQQRTEPDFDFLEEIVSSYESFAGKEEELVPMNLTSFYNENATQAYRSLSYYRAGTAYYFLQDLLGEEIFTKALQEYIHRWAGKHPLPYDFFHTFNNVSGQDLSWYWKPWFFEQGYPDLALQEAELTGDILSLKIEKLGNIPVPLHIRIIYADDSTDELSFNASIWKDRNVFYQSKKNDRAIKTVTITSKYIPDIDKSNNTHHFNNE